MNVDLRLGDCLEVMKTLESGSVDAVVTDPPAGISFMGKEWDSQRTRERFVDFLAPRMAEARRVAKPGAYALVWAIPRTSHWTALALEEAGWVIRDRVSHLFGTGFPKAKSCLKPACEDWWLAWNPAKRVTPLQINRCRIESEGGRQRESEPSQERRYTESGGTNFAALPGPRGGDPAGRWPANVTHDGSPEVLEAFAAFGERGGGMATRGASTRIYGGGKGFTGATGEEIGYGDTGTAARFFYCSKASRADRGPDNTHPTVKNTELMRWLCRLITPPGGTVLDLFAGSGSTGKACVLEGFGFLGIEQSPEYHAIAVSRIEAARNQDNQADFLDPLGSGAA